MNTALKAKAADAKAGAKAEWLEADGLGGFSSGTASGIRTRRYHALLLQAQTPPTGRVVLVNGMEVWVDTPDGSFSLSSQAYTPDTIHPDGSKRIVAFTQDPWPTWVYELENGTRIEQSLFVPRRRPMVVVRWRVLGGAAAALRVRPLLSGRDYHALHHENDSFNFEAAVSGPRVTWSPYRSVPKITALTNGAYEHGPLWYRHFLYWEELDRGLDNVEDLASPGTFHWNLTHEDAVLIFSAAECSWADLTRPEAVSAFAAGLRESEARRRGRFKDPLRRAADAYIVQRGRGETIVAGYPWFTDWGRDTFIALRGLCSSCLELDTARRILVEWSGAVSRGMLPNFFPDAAREPEYNSVDASLWYIIASDEYLRQARANGQPAGVETTRKLRRAVLAIIEGYAAGTRHGIRLDDDGLLAAGAPGVQLTWMDAKIGDWVVTPRTGKPVEVQALWLNALRIASEFEPRWAETYLKGRASFNARFWNEERGCLFDVVDADHVPGQNDATLRPNQIFAVGGLPHPLIEGERACRIVEVVERELFTPLGLRSLAPSEPGYRPRYEGGPAERDSAYHQGTAWPWLMGAFVEAWVRVRGGSDDARSEAAHRFLPPLLQHLNEAGLGHVSEIVDGDSPHTPRGCPFQAWSLGELIRLCVFLGNGHRGHTIRPSEFGLEAASIFHLEATNQREAMLT